MKSKHISTVIGLTFLALTACSKPASESAYGDTTVAELATPATGGADKAASPSKPMISVPQLAYDYEYGFTANAKGLAALIASDQSVCENAGPAACQVISLTANSAPDADYVNKKLELRATPEWLKAWQGTLAARLDKSDGKIASQTVTSEDLSLQIVDMDAHIKNKVALRDRLQQIIRTSSGKISDLIEAETQLSEVQQDIDSSQSSLAVMQKRVATVHLTLNYESRAVAASRGTFSPVNEALKGVLGNMMGVIGFLITLLSFLLPLALIAAPLIWFAWKWRQKRDAKTQATKTASSEKET